VNSINFETNFLELVRGGRKWGRNRDFLGLWLVSILLFSELQPPAFLFTKERPQNKLFWPEIKWEYALNLSILFSAGKESNRDPPSNGEWRGESSNLKSGRGPRPRIVVLRVAPWFGRFYASSLEQDATEGDSPVALNWNKAKQYLLLLWRVAYPEIGALNGRWTPPKAKYYRETDSKEVLCRKSQTALWKESEKYPKPLKRKVLDPVIFLPHADSWLWAKTGGCRVSSPSRAVARCSCGWAKAFTSVCVRVNIHCWTQEKGWGKLEWGKPCACSVTVQPPSNTVLAMEAANAGTERLWRDPWWPVA